MIKAAPPKKPKLLRYFGIFLLGVVVFLVSFWLLFPYAEVERRAVTELGKRGVDAEITGISPRTPLSYRIDSIRLYRAYGKDLDLRFTDTIVDLSIGDILNERIGLAIDTGFLGGKIKANLTVPSPDKLQLSWDSIDLSRVAPLLPDAGTEIRGKATGDGTVYLPFTSVTSLDGSITTSLSDVTVGPIRVMGFQIEPISIGTGKLRAEAQKGRVKVYDTAFSGGDIGVNLDGTITLLAPVTRSPMEAAVTLAPTQNALNQFNFAFSMLNEFKSGDGSYKMNIGGTPAAPSVRAR